MTMIDVRGSVDVRGSRPTLPMSQRFSKREDGHQTPPLRLMFHVCLYLSLWTVGFKEWVDGRAEEWVDGGMGLRVGFININDMYNNDVGKGGVK